MKSFFYSFLHIKVKKSQTILITTLFLFLSVVMLVGIGIYNATNKSIQNLKESLGGSFTIEVKNFTRDERPDLYKSYVGLDGKEYYQLYSKVALTDEVIDNILKVKEIEKYNVESFLYPYLSDSTLKGGLFTGCLKDMEENIEYEKVYGNDTEIYMKLTTIYTVSDSSLYSYFRNGTFTLTQGRGIQANDKDKVIVSDDFAKRNNVNIGDKIPAAFYKEFLTKEDFEIIDSYDLEIVGLFKVNTTQGNLEYINEADILENIMFSDLNFLQDSYDCGSSKNLLETSKSEEYSLATFFVKDPKKLEATMKKVKKMMGSDLEYWEIKKDDTTYKSSVEPLSAMKKIIIVSLVIVCGTSMILLSLLSTMWMLERKREISILLSLGKSKAEVLGRFLIEYLILSTVAIVVAFLLSTTISNKMGNQLLDFVLPKESTSKEETSLDENDYVDEAGNMDMISFTEDAISFQTLSQTPDSIDISIGAKEFAIVFGIEWAILGISVLRMGNRLWKMKPREIISDLS